MQIQRTTDFDYLAKAMGCSAAHVARPEFSWYRVTRPLPSEPGESQDCGFFLIIDMVENVELHLRLSNLSSGKETLAAVKQMLSIAAKEYRCPVRARIPRVGHDNKRGRAIHWGAVAAGFKRLAMSTGLIAYEWRANWKVQT